ncbi:MAG: hypothetical protein Q4E07_05775 [Eubacteriales bacterium]|nr:hypothetical protein [Eubacteriales bacterium]
MKAPIIIGSNSLRMLVDGKHGKKRFRQETKLFTKLDKNGNISRENILQLAEYINIFIDKAMTLGAELFFLAATSAVRDAKNQAEIISIIEKLCGLPLNILTGEQEALLSFIGATDCNRNCGVIDIGGGSTEIAVNDSKVIDNAYSKPIEYKTENPKEHKTEKINLDSANLNSLNYKSLSFQIGAARLYNSVQINSKKDIESALTEASKALENMNFNADTWYFVGGTATILAQIIKKEEPSLTLLDTKITYKQAEEVLSLLADTPANKRNLIKGVPKGRENILPTGIAILLSIMKKYGITSVCATERSNLDGALKAQHIHFVRRKL